MIQAAEDMKGHQIMCISRRMYNKILTNKFTRMPCTIREVENNYEGIENNYLILASIRMQIGQFRERDTLYISEIFVAMDRVENIRILKSIIDATILVARRRNLPITCGTVENDDVAEFLRKVGFQKFKTLPGYTFYTERHLVSRPANNFR